LEEQITKLNSFAWFDVQSIRGERERGIQEMQVKIRAKEAEHRAQLAQLTERYGKKIEELTSSVQLLQSQLILDE